MAAARRWRVNTGLDYEVKGKPVRREPGDLVSDIPKGSQGWLAEQGHISPVEDGAK